MNNLNDLLDSLEMNAPIRIKARLVKPYVPDFDWRTGW